MFDYSAMSNRDLGDLITYLKEIPPVDKKFSVASYGPMIPIFPALGVFTPAANIDHRNTTRATDVVPGTSVEYGEYLFTTCAQCHGESFARTLKNWKKEDFIKTFNTGVLPNGKYFGRTMSSNIIMEMSDAELTSLWLYVSNDSH